MFKIAARRPIGRRFARGTGAVPGIVSAVSQDPEQRIADLERRLALPGAGLEYSLEPPRTGLRLGWIALGLLVAALVVGGGAILAGHSPGTVSGIPVAAEPPPVTAGRPTVALPTPLPEVSTPIPRSLPAPDLSWPGGSINVSGSHNNRTVECRESVIFVSGVDNTVTLNGHCTRIDVSGVQNTVTITSSDAIVVSGVRNTVIFLSGTPQLSKTGIDNTINGR